MLAKFTSNVFEEPYKDAMFKFVSKLSENWETSSIFSLTKFKRFILFKQNHEKFNENSLFIFKQTQKMQKYMDLHTLKA